MKKQFTSFILTIAMIIAMIPAVSLPAYAANSASPAVIDVGDNSGTNLPAGVTYASSGGVGVFTIGSGASNIDITGTTTQNVIVVTNSAIVTLTLSGASITAPDSSAYSPIDLQGNSNVTLQLADGTTSTASAINADYRAGIHVASKGGIGAALTITGTGILNAKGNTSCGGAGIGGNGTGENGGIITIDSGTINATGGYSAGIGGGGTSGPLTCGIGGNITISGGTVNATGGHTGAGIGGGGNAGVAGYTDGGMINISGNANVTATGGQAGAGIGGGGNGSGGTINISGSANITATSGNGGAGIGGGGGGPCGNITINSGTVSATSNLDGAGIGGGWSDQVGGGIITINGGTVTARSAQRGAGIGGGGMKSAGNIIITGGIVDATGGTNGAGIGGGGITNGTGNGAGGAGGTITISGGTVNATGGAKGAGIGGGVGYDAVTTHADVLGTGGSITIGPAAIVTAVSDGAGNPAIQAVGGSGSVINAKLDNAISAGSNTYLKCNGNKLMLPANYKDFAFSAAVASLISAWSDPACTSSISDIVTTPGGVANIPLSTTIGAIPTPVTFAHAYTLTVNLNDGDGPTQSNSYISGAAVSVDAGAKNGYTFNGWTSSNGGSFAAAGSASTTFTMPGNATTITAIWTQNTYPLTVNLDGGIGGTTGGPYASGAAVSITAGTRNGYTFSSWTSSNGGSFAAAGNAATTFTMPGNATTITAIWTQNTYPLTVNLNGGNGPTGNGSHASGAAVSIDAGTKNGYAFNGWTSSNGGSFAAAGNAVTTFTMPGNATTITAIWTQNTYPLTVNLDGGIGGTTGGSYASGAAVSVNAGTKNGYTFNGWTSSNGGSFASAGNAATTFTMPGNATTITAIWTLNSGGGSGSGNGGGNGGGGGSHTAPGTNIIIDGDNYTIGDENKESDDTTVTVDQNKFDDGIEKASDHSGAIIPVSGNANVTARLVVKNIEEMAKKDMTLTVQTGKISYNLDTTAIDTAKITAALGMTDTSKIPFDVKISNSNAVVNGTTVVVSPMEFTITATYNGKTATVDKFSSFVSRTIEITADQAKKITTAVVVEQNGSLRHVPTKVTVIDGKYYAVINSLTNSTYTEIWHPVEFSDVTAHWAKETINDMGSRMVISGVGQSNFEPDRDITRAEFAAIIIRALGLAPGDGMSSFTDVSNSDWYCCYVKTAAEYGIITGYDAATFGPNDKITREQAMTMIARAMKITGLKSELKDSEMSALIANYTDGTAASDYAKTSIAACLKAGVVAGRTSDTIAPKNCITRAEVAVIVQRLLKKSDLI